MQTCAAAQFCLLCASHKHTPPPHRYDSSLSQQICLFVVFAAPLALPSTGRHQLTVIPQTQLPAEKPSQPSFCVDAPRSSSEHELLQFETLEEFHVAQRAATVQTVCDHSKRFVYSSNRANVCDFSFPECFWFKVLFHSQSNCAFMAIFRFAFAT